MNFSDTVINNVGLILKKLENVEINHKNSIMALEII